MLNCEEPHLLPLPSLIFLIDQSVDVWVKKILFFFKFKYLAHTYYFIWQKCNHTLKSVAHHILDLEVAAHGKDKVEHHCLNE
jgi:hypothetical protein